MVLLTSIGEVVRWWKEYFEDLLQLMNTFFTEEAEMRTSTFKSETIILSQKEVNFLFQVRCEVHPQVKKFKYLGTVFTSEGGIEQVIFRRMQHLLWYELLTGLKLKDKIFCLPVDLCSFSRPVAQKVEVHYMRRARGGAKAMGGKTF